MGKIFKSLLTLIFVAVPFILFFDLPIRFLWKNLPKIEMEAVINEAAKSARQILFLKNGKTEIPSELAEIVICDCRTKKLLFPNNKPAESDFFVPCGGENMKLTSFKRTIYTENFTDVKIAFPMEDLEGHYAITYHYPGIVDHHIKKLEPWIFAWFVGLYIVIICVWLYYLQKARVERLILNSIPQVNEHRLNIRLKPGAWGNYNKLIKHFNLLMERLEEAFQIQQSFVSQASHELRTPLTSIISQLEVTLVNDRPVKEYKNLLSSILEDVKRISHLVQALLEMARTTADPSVISFSQIRVDELLWQCMADLLKQNPNYKIEIEFAEIPDMESALEMKGNEEMLKSVFGNLMENGCKFSPDHAVKVNVTLNQNEVKLEFTDNGIGIEKDEMAKLFQPFFRSRKSGHIHGNGIGLLLAKRILTVHQGMIKIESESGHWTKVNVTIPRGF